MAALAALQLAAGASAQTANPEGEQLKTTEQQIESSKALQQRLAAEVEAAVREQEEVSERLIAMSTRMRELEAAITASEADLKRLQEDQVVLMASLGEKQEVLSELLAGLQRLEQNPPPALVVEPQDILAALRGAMLFGAVVPELKADAEKLVADLARLETLRNEITARRADMAGDIARLETSRGDLQALIERKRALVESGNANLETERKRAAELAAKATSLKQLMANLATERQRIETERAQKAAADEQERRRLEELKRRPKMIFADAKGRLGLPVEGDILRRFGEADGLGGQSQGLVLASRAGAQVTAPADGEVEFAGSFRSYGEVVILNPGGGYRILLAGLGEVTVVTGETLRVGEPLGRMGHGPSSVTLLGDLVQNGKPVLYIEFRNSSDVIDSGPWWAESKREARG